MVEAVYVGSLGRKLISNVETNFPDPTVMQQQINNFGSDNPECARPLAACVDFIGGPGFRAHSPIRMHSRREHNNCSPTSATASSTVRVSVNRGQTLQQGIHLPRGLHPVENDGSHLRIPSTFVGIHGPLDYRLDRALADFDTPQRLVISGVWELPFDRGVENAIMKKVLGGWQFNAIATFQKGNPFTLFSNNNSSQQDQNPDLSRPDVIGPTQYISPRSQTAVQAIPSTSNPNEPYANSIDPSVADSNVR